MTSFLKAVKRKINLGFYERKGVVPLRIIGKYLPKKPVIIEAGAHVGYDTNKMYKYWPDSTIYAFEPVPNLYKKLVENTKSLDKVYCFPFALSDNTGTSSLYISEGASDGSSFSLRPKEHLNFHPDTIFQEEIEVETITLDEWAVNFCIDQIDMLWLDIQGYEFQF